MKRLGAGSWALAFVASLLRTVVAFAQDAAPVTPVASPEGGLRATASPPMKWVDLEAPSGVRLEQDAAGNGDWNLVCAAPCAMEVSSASAYRIVGDGVRRSRPFTLRAPDGVPERLVVKTASSTLLTVGVVGTSVGVTSGVVGYFGYALWSAADSVATGVAEGVTGGRAPATSESPPFWIPLTLVGGAPLAAVSFVLVLTNERTDVQQVYPGEPPPPPWVPPRIHAESPELTRFPTVVLVPLLTRTF